MYKLLTMLSHRLDKKTAGLYSYTTSPSHPLFKKKEEVGNVVAAVMSVSSVFTRKGKCVLTPANTLLARLNKLFTHQR